MKSNAARNSFLLFALSLFLLSSSCDKNNEVPNPEEEITTLTYTLSPIAGGQTAVLSFRDPDGNGGNPPIITVDSLKANTIYFGELEVLNESVSPAIDVTTEILAEDEDHQFFYEINGLHATVEYADEDSDGFPVGIETALTAAGAGTGTIVITLRHKPNKSAEGVIDGIILNAGGETDIEVEFPVVIVP